MQVLLRLIEILVNQFVRDYQSVHCDEWNSIQCNLMTSLQIITKIDNYNYIEPILNIPSITDFLKLGLISEQFKTVLHANTIIGSVFYQDNSYIEQFLLKVPEVYFLILHNLVEENLYYYQCPDEERSNQQYTLAK